jgi:hypothetical protein
MFAAAPDGTEERADELLACLVGTLAASEASEPSTPVTVRRASYL